MSLMHSCACAFLCSLSSCSPHSGQGKYVKRLTHTSSGWQTLANNNLSRLPTINDKLVTRIVLFRTTELTQEIAPNCSHHNELLTLAPMHNKDKQTSKTSHHRFPHRATAKGDLPIHPGAEPTGGAQGEISAVAVSYYTHGLHCQLHHCGCFCIKGRA